MIDRDIANLELRIRHAVGLVVWPVVGGVFGALIGVIFGFVVGGGRPSEPWRRHRRRLRGTRHRRRRRVLHLGRDPHHTFPFQGTPGRLTSGHV